MTTSESGWDHESLSGELTNAGFVSLRKAQFGDSGDLMFDRVEEKSRWVGGVLASQCNKP